MFREVTAWAWAAILLDDGSGPRRPSLAAQVWIAQAWAAEAWAAEAWTAEAWAVQAWAASAPGLEQPAEGC